jgi:hypothetical protein
MGQYRKSTHDVPERRTAKRTTPGTIPGNKVGVYDHKNRLRGVVGRLATSVTASRFLSGRPASLQTVNGQPAWKQTLAEVSAAGTNPNAMLPPSPPPPSKLKG